MASFSIPPTVLISSGLDTAFVAHCAFFISCVLVWAVICGWILHRVCAIPTIAGQIIGGIILGPSLMNISGWAIFAHPVYFSDRATGTVYALISSDLCAFFVLLLSAVLTVSYLLWIAGYETDIHDIAKVGRAAISAGLLGAVLPIGIIWVGLMIIAPQLFSDVQAVGMGLIFAATSVSIPIAMLFSLKMMHLRSSKATLGAAIIDDIVAVILLSMFFIAAQSGFFGIPSGAMHGHTVSLMHALGYLLLSFVIIIAVGAYVIPHLIRWLGAKERAHLIPSVANGVMLMYFAFAELVGGLAGITGAYFAGLFHRRGDDHGHAQGIIAPFTQTILLPLFLGSVGLQLNISILTFGQWLLVGYVLVLALFSKFCACFIAMWISNWGVYDEQQRWSWLDGFLFGASMVARGEVGLVVSTVLCGSALITQEQYVIAVVTIVLTTIASPVLLAAGLSYLQVTPERTDEAEFSCTIGPFAHIGTSRMFDIIGAYMQDRQTHLSTSLNQERQMITLDGEKVKIILCPQEGIVLQGDRGRIQAILIEFQKALNEENRRLLPPALQK